MNDLKKEIENGEHWRVVIRPAQSFYSEDRLEIKELEDILRRTQVRQRGWYYPHLGRESISPVSQIAIGDGAKFMGKAEYWEFSRSGQFGHIFAFDEDGTIDEPLAAKIRDSFIFEKDKAAEVKKFLNIIRTIYTTTEIFMFATRLAQEKGYEDVDEFEIIIELYGVKGRMLYINDFFRELWAPYICNIAEDKILFRRTYKRDELIGSYAAFALERVEEIFRLFGWKEPNMTQSKEDQQKLIDGRF